MSRNAGRSGIAALAFAALLGGLPAPAPAQQPAGQSVRIDPHAIGGVVTGAQGPEAGVWVIAETNSLPTKMVKIVVTDERGRYAIPELPGGSTTSGYAAMVLSTRRRSKASRARLWI